MTSSVRLARVSDERRSRKCGTFGSITRDEVKAKRELPMAAEGIIHSANTEPGHFDIRVVPANFGADCDKAVRGPVQPKRDLGEVAAPNLVCRGGGEDPRSIFVAKPLDTQPQ